MRDHKAEKRSFVDIDPDYLDQEWLAQSRLVKDQGDKLADAILDMDAAEAYADLVAAKLELRMRTDPASYNLPKVTDAVIKAAVTAHKKYQDALKVYHDAKHKVNKLKASVKALDHKKTSLENIVVMEGREWFSEPQVPKGAGAKAKENAERFVRKKAREAGRVFRDRRRDEGEDNDAD